MLTVSFDLETPRPHCELRRQATWWNAALCCADHQPHHRVFPSHQQANQTQLSMVLEGIVCQALLPKKSSKGRVVGPVLVPTAMKPSP